VDRRGGRGRVIGGVEDALAFAADHHSTGLVILRQGRIVAEKYWNGWTADTAQPIYSSSKSLTSVLIGMAIEEGRITSVRQSASDFVPAWKGSPKAAITIRHMLTMTSGIRNTVGTIKDDVDAFEETAALPLDHQPGEFWAYNTPVYRMLLRVIEHATGQSIEQYTQRKLAGPLGFQHSSWDCSPAPNNTTNYSWYRKVFAACRASACMLWPDCPRDAFGALGAQDRKIYVVPSLDLVVSRHGGAAGLASAAAGEGGGRASFDNQLLGRVCRAVK
jgi:CubicO group peptidase (beta-lactamase class C family)